MHQTPQQRNAQWRGTTNASSSPNLRLSASTRNSISTKTSTVVNRKVSSNAPIGRSPRTPGGNMIDADLSVGDLVNVPGDMHGTVRFVGSVKGKAGRFVGVELSREFATRGKNDGDVDGTHYFRTTIPGSGIFLPAHRAERRASPALSYDEFPDTPTTPSYASYRGSQYQATDDYTPPTPGVPKFSQSMGPGARPPSPHFKPKSRPSLPRPESPFRKQPTLAPTPARNFSMSQRAAAVPPRFATSPAPPRVNTPRAPSTASRPPTASRPYSRNSSRLGHRSDAAAERGSATPGAMSTFPPPRRSPSRQMTTNPDQEDEIRRLLAQLEEKDRQLREQADTLAEMDTSLKEIQALIPDDNGADADDMADNAELRLALREKNDKVQSLVSEFDAHRADFRSTIDTLELASAETERVYEAKVTDLLAEIQELREIGHSREDVELVAQQLRGLEELVAELEEGLEDARRGEAEARGEVEFLRGEVERGRSELRREREKAAKALQGAKEAEGIQSRSKDVEMRDDEIRGLKAIIHSLSTGPESASPAPRNDHASSQAVDNEELERTHAAVQQLEREKSELQGLVERKAFREEELERAIEQLRKAAEQERDSIVRDGTTSPQSLRRHKTQSPAKQHFSPVRPSTSQEDQPWCEVCETKGHDILTCRNMFGNRKKALDHDVTSHEDEHEELAEDMRGMSVSQNGDQYSNADTSSHADDIADQPKKENNDTHATAGDADADKWCALCEKDGHLAYDCPEEL